MGNPASRPPKPKPSNDSFPTPQSKTVAKMRTFKQSSKQQQQQQQQWNKGSNSNNNNITSWFSGAKTFKQNHSPPPPRTRLPRRPNYLNNTESSRQRRLAMERNHNSEKKNYGNARRAFRGSVEGGGMFDFDTLDTTPANSAFLNHSLHRHHHCPNNPQDEGKHPFKNSKYPLVFYSSDYNDQCNSNRDTRVFTSKINKETEEDEDEDEVNDPQMRGIDPKSTGKLPPWMTGMEENRIGPGPGSVPTTLPFGIKFKKRKRILQAPYNTPVTESSHDFVTQSQIQLNLLMGRTMHKSFLMSGVGVGIPSETATITTTTTTTTTAHFSSSPSNINCNLNSDTSFGDKLGLGETTLTPVPLPLHRPITTQTTFETPLQTPFSTPKGSQFKFQFPCEIQTKIKTKENNSNSQFMSNSDSGLVTRKVPKKPRAPSPSISSGRSQFEMKVNVNDLLGPGGSELGRLKKPKELQVQVLPSQRLGFQTFTSGDSFEGAAHAHETKNYPHNPTVSVHRGTSTMGTNLDAENANEPHVIFSSVSASSSSVYYEYGGRACRQVIPRKRREGEELQPSILKTLHTAFYLSDSRGGAAGKPRKKRRMWDISTLFEDPEQGTTNKNGCSQNSEVRGGLQMSQKSPPQLPLKPTAHKIPTGKTKRQHPLENTHNSNLHSTERYWERERSPLKDLKSAHESESALRLRLHDKYIKELQLQNKKNLRLEVSTSMGGATPGILNLYQLLASQREDQGGGIPQSDSNSSAITETETSRKSWELCSSRSASSIVSTNKFHQDYLYGSQQQEPLKKSLSVYDCKNTQNSWKISKETCESSSEEGEGRGLNEKDARALFFPHENGNFKGKTKDLNVVLQPRNLKLNTCDSCWEGGKKGQDKGDKRDVNFDLTGDKEFYIMNCGCNNCCRRLCPRPRPRCRLPLVSNSNVFCPPPNFCNPCSKPCCPCPCPPQCPDSCCGGCPCQSRCPAPCPCPCSCPKPSCRPCPCPRPCTCKQCCERPPPPKPRQAPMKSRGVSPCPSKITKPPLPPKPNPAPGPGPKIPQKCFPPPCCYPPQCCPPPCYPPQCCPPPCCPPPCYPPPCYPPPGCCPPPCCPPPRCQPPCSPPPCCQPQCCPPSCCPSPCCPPPCCPPPRCPPPCGPPEGYPSCCPPPYCYPYCSPYYQYPPRYGGDPSPGSGYRPMGSGAPSQPDQYQYRCPCPECSRSPCCYDPYQMQWAWPPSCACACGGSCGGAQGTIPNKNSNTNNSSTQSIQLTRKDKPT